MLENTNFIKIPIRENLKRPLSLLADCVQHGNCIGERLIILRPSAEVRDDDVGCLFSFNMLWCCACVLLSVYALLVYCCGG